MGGGLGPETGRERTRERERRGRGIVPFLACFHPSSPFSSFSSPSSWPSLATATDFMNFHFDVFVLESGGRSRSTKSTGGMRNRDEWNGSNEWACCTVTRSAGNVYSLSLSRFPFFISFRLPFLPLSFFFPRPSFSSSFSRWFIHWILFPFRPSSFSLNSFFFQLVAPLVRLAVAMGNSLFLSFSLSLSRELRGW